MIDFTPNSYWVGTHRGYKVEIVYRAKAEKPSPDSGWAILCRNSIWDKDLREWIYEPSPSHRDELFLQNTRFNLAEAKSLIFEAMSHKDNIY